MQQVVVETAQVAVMTLVFFPFPSEAVVTHVLTTGEYDSAGCQDGGRVVGRRLIFREQSWRQRRWRAQLRQAAAESAPQSGTS